ncbi:MAG: ATP-binding protein [Myxococcota bacterium]
MPNADGDRRTLIDELRQSEERFRAICENAPFMIDQFDERGRCILWNGECARCLGYTQQEVQASRDPLALFYPEAKQRARVRSALEKADGTFREYRVRAKDGSTRLQMWADFRLPSGATISVGQDVTEQRRTEAQLRQSQKMEALGQLTGGMAHDFNNLLTLVLSHAELLEKQENLSDEAAWALGEIKRAATRGETMIRSLLAFSRHRVLEVGPVDLNQLVHEMAATIVHLLPDHIQVRVQTEPSLPPAQADSGAVEQSLLNLVTNARDAMPDGGRLTISVSPQWLGDGQQRRQYIAIAVEDDGRGMDEVSIRRVFEPFFSTKEEGHGSGLGLAMVYGLMQQQGGEVRLESELGEGTTAVLLFPVVGGGERGRPSEGAGPGFRILVVEDEAPLRSVARQILELEGYEVLEAPHGRAALEVLRSQAVDLVLTDVTMPLMGGLPLYQTAKEQLPSCPPFLFVSGFAEDEQLQRLHREGHVLILRKPYRMDQMLRAVSRSLAARGLASSG